MHEGTLAKGFWIFSMRYAQGIGTTHSPLSLHSMRLHKFAHFPGLSRYPRLICFNTTKGESLEAIDKPGQRSVIVPWVFIFHRNWLKETKQAGIKFVLI